MRRALAIAVAIVASCGIVSAGVIDSPMWAAAALERAAVVDSPDAHRLAAAPETVPAPVEDVEAIEVAAPPAPAPGPVAAAEPPPAARPAPSAPAAAPGPTPAPAPGPAPEPVDEPKASPVRTGTRDAECESSMLRWMNETRIGAGRAPLTWDDAILHVPVGWSHDMSARRELAHNPDYGDQVFAARAEAMTAAENVGWGTGPARAVYDEFLRSPTHKDKILSGSLTHTAVACVRDADDEVWVTVNFWG